MSDVGSVDNPLVVAVIGSGPSGFYAAEALLKSDLSVKVHIIEKLPSPFGLVRYGVAPDHPKLKQVSLLFHKIAQHPDLHYYGNVEFGVDVTLTELKATHHAVVFCNGADSDRKLGIPGEDLPGSHTATEFVAWYNGHPAYRHHQFDLRQETAVIIGQGNVAADVCRILAKPIDELKTTDIASHALEQLAESKVRNIHVIGRRGPAQAKFTSKELRELGEQTNCFTSVDSTGYQLDSADEEELADKANENSAKCSALFEQFKQREIYEQTKKIQFHFLLSPQQLLGENRLEKIIFNRNQLSGNAFSQVAQSTDETMELDCGLCFRSIGYRGQPLPDVPFDTKRGVIPNNKGQVVDQYGNPKEQLYVSGWIKRGPSGIIGTNRADSVETIATLLSDITKLVAKGTIAESALSEILKVKNDSTINYPQWQKIDAVETRLGSENGKPREKITDVNQMLAIVR